MQENISMEDADDSEHEGPLVIADVDQSPEEKLEPGNQSACNSGDGGNSVDGAYKAEAVSCRNCQIQWFSSNKSSVDWSRHDDEHSKVVSAETEQLEGRLQVQILPLLEPAQVENS